MDGWMDGWNDVLKEGAYSVVISFKNRISFLSLFLFSPLKEKLC